LNTKLKDVNTLLISSTTEVVKLNDARLDHATKNGTLQHHQGEFDNLDKTYEISINESRSKIENLNTSIITDTSKLSGINNSIGLLNRKLDILEFWKKAFSDTGIKAILLDEAIPVLNEKARELSGLVSNIKVRFDSQTQIKSGDMRNKFAVNVIQTQNLTDDRGDFSGGEGKVVDIVTLMCLRRLLETMQNISFNIILLDEVLDALDETNVDIVLGMIQELSEQYCVVLLTHTWKDRIECDEHLPM
jgi:DNA repair exonuclease SbcCD ATPase subunit